MTNPCEGGTKSPKAWRVIVIDPECDLEEDFLEFRLTYSGLLLGSNKAKTRAAHKHEIRKAFHPQLKRLWAEQANLVALCESKTGKVNMHDRLAANYARNGFRFVPLVSRHFSLFCEVDILLLRPGGPGGLFNSGDIDGKMKTLFDALRMPQDAGELAGSGPGEAEDPFYCLLENDDLISKVHMEADMLLEPVPDCDTPNAARVIITVRTKPQAVTWGNIGFG